MRNQSASLSKWFSCTFTGSQSGWIRWKTLCGMFFHILTGNILSAELLPDFFHLNYLHYGAQRQMDTHEAMQPEQNTCKHNQEWLLQKCHYLMSASCTSASCFYPPRGTAAFLLSFFFPTKFTRRVCLLWAALTCEVSRSGWVHISVYVLTDSAQPDPGKGLWGLHSIGEHYFCLAYPEAPWSPPFLCLPYCRTTALPYFLFSGADPSWILVSPIWFCFWIDKKKIQNQRSTLYLKQHFLMISVEAFV